MTFRPSHPAAKDLVNSNEDQSSSGRPVRGQPSAWGLPAPRRGLAPLSTNLNSSLESGPSRTSSSASPFTASFSSVLNPSSQDEGVRRGQSSNTSRSTFPSGQSGSQQGQAGQVLLSPRSRAITPSSTAQSASSAAASTTASQTGGGGSGSGGGGSRNLSFSPPPVTSPTNNSFERSPFGGSNPSSATSSQSSVSKIVTTQIFLLLGSITEKEGKAKWESQAEAIRKLVESNGMESFGKYFRRLVQGNSPQIFGLTRNVENAANYPMLVQEMSKITQDPGQAQRIADALDTTDPDNFREFDLATFMNHFDLNSYAKVLLASAVTHISRQDLRSKAGTVLTNTFEEFLSDLSNAHNDDPDTNPSLIATCALKYYQDVPESLKSKGDVAKLQMSLELRYKKQRVTPPPEIQSTMVLLELLDSENILVNEICHHGPQITVNGESATAFISQLPIGNIDEKEISLGLLFLLLTPDWHDYDLSVLIASLHDYPGLRNVNWRNVIKGLDYKGVDITKEKFLSLFNALLPLAKEDSQLDLQTLWGGQWANYETQLSFLRAFLTSTASELDASKIPQLRQAYDPLESLEASDDLASAADKARRDTMISLDAVAAVIDLLVPANEAPSPGNAAYLTELLSEKAGLFLCSLMGIAQPWTTGQSNLMKTLFRNFLGGNAQRSNYVLHTMWKLNKQWVALCLMDLHYEDPLELVLIFDVAQEMGWMDDLLTLETGFGIDLAALALRKGTIDLEQWLKDKTVSGPNSTIFAISKFLVLKAQDELRTSRDEQPQPRTVTLSMKTVYDMLGLLDEHLEDRLELKGLQRQCLQAYPRLIIYSEGVTENLDVDCTESNSLPRTADAEMQDLYKRMYGGELSVQNILEYLQECKASDDPARVDLFACMVHGLFDEFSCFSEYPLGPLATTAVLFGGVMQVRLISDLSLRVGQDMVLDSVRDYPPEEKMYKFGLQALLHVIDRFQEPEWIEYCAKLVSIPGLRGTQAYNAASQALSQNRGSEDSNEVNGLNEDPLLMNGGDEVPRPDSRVQFKSFNVEAISTPEEPDEATQEKIIFFFNNVTEQNLKTKIGQIESTLTNKYQPWFAQSLVEGRAKLEPNNQSLYMAILELLSNKLLWNEVLKETLFSVQKLLNAESTMQSSTDRKALKNLSIWLGSLTLARDKPIKHKNIAFLDLLVEGLNMQKLILVIPFTCHVLAQGARSQVFKPPNPWLVEVIAALMELYREAEIKLNLKFEIEVLLKEFGLTIDSIPPSTNFRERRLQEEDLSNPLLSDGLDNFDDLALGAINRGTRNSRFDIDALTSNMPDLESILNFPPPSGSAANQTRLRQIVQEAVRRAIIEIVAPVVERSVTIATIATTSVIHKDFATEVDEDRIRRAAQQMVRQLAGSLALVTCKEPLKMSMTNYIRMAQAELPDQAVPEGAILMCVNDNLDVACGIVEKQAEERSIPEIEAHIDNELAIRRRHRVEHPNEAFISDSYSRWSSYIPDPYKQTPGGLNPEQMAIYTEFARQSRGPTSHAQTLSADSGRQLPDVLQDAFSSMPNVPSAGESLAMPRPNSQPPQLPFQGRMPPPHLQNSVRQPQTNGFMDAASYDERIQDLIGEIRRVIQERAADSPTDIQRSNAVFDLLNQIWATIEAAPEAVAMNCAENICKTLYGDSMMHEEIETFVRLLSKLYETYAAIRTEVTEWSRSQDDERFLTVDVTVLLVRYEIVQIRIVDAALTRLIYSRGEIVLEYVSELMDALVLNKRPAALRADFAGTMGALSQYYADNPSSSSARALIDRLKEWGNDDNLGDASEQSGVKEYLLKYVFAEWCRLCEFNPGLPHERHSSAFVSQLISRRIIGTQEDTANFLRLCIDAVVERHDRLDPALAQIPSKAFWETDALASLIVVLVKSQTDLNGTAKTSKALYMDSLLSLITLIMNDHAVKRTEHFNQRVFFRLWSSVFYNWNDFGREGSVHDGEMLIVFAENLLAANPKYFPAFTFGWLMLISHRVLMPGLLRLPGEKGYGVFCNLITTALSHAGSFLKLRPAQPFSDDLYKGVLRILLTLHHDFPEFLIAHHYRICNSILPHCVQLFDLVLSAFPPSISELPNPFATGLKVDRIEEIRKPPKIAGDHLTVLKNAGIFDALNGALKTANSSATISNTIIEAVNLYDSTVPVDIPLLNAVVLHIGEFAVSAAGQKTNQPFQPSAPPANILMKLAKDFSTSSVYYLIGAIVNQLRYPNSHTQYFSSALLHIFDGCDPNDPSSSELAALIAKVLIERLIVAKPHPWGLVSTTLEMLKNPDHAFWRHSFVKELPAIQETCADILKANSDQDLQQQWLLAQAHHHQLNEHEQF